MFLSSRLREFRMGTGATQGMVASHLSISREAYSQYENGKRKPSLDSLCAICRALSVSADFLLGQAPVSLSFSTMSPQERYIITHLHRLDRDGLDLMMLILQTMLEQDLT